MNAPCKYDDRLLDYLYEEMNAQEAAEFSAHVSGCTLCQKSLAGFRRVRSTMAEVQGAPQERTEEALTRLTAQVLQQVARPSAGMGTKTLGSTQNLPSAEMGKMLPLRRRGRLAAMFHPAIPILAVAATALVFVMLKQQQGGPLVQPERLAPPASISPAPSLAPAGSRPAEALPEEEAEQAAAPVMQLQDKDKGGLARGPMKPARSVGAPVAKPATTATPTLADPSAAMDEKKASSKDNARKEAYRADDLDALADGAKAELQAKAPEPRAPEARRQEAEGRFARPPQDAPPPPVAQAAPRGDAKPSLTRPAPAGAGYSQSEAQEGNETMKQAVQNSQRDALDSALNKNRDEAAALLRQLREHLREGRCKEAGDTLNQLEQKFHGTEVPTEDRLALQRCAPQDVFAEPSQMQEAAPRRRAIAPPAKAARAKAKAPPSRGKADKASAY